MEPPGPLTAYRYNNTGVLLSAPLGSCRQGDNKKGYTETEGALWLVATLASSTAVPQHDYGIATPEYGASGYWLLRSSYK